MIIVSRRRLLGGVATFPLIALVSSPPLIAACGERPPETPLAHLYGAEWVHNAYKLYADKYTNVQTSAEVTSEEAYTVLAQKGIVALDALQSRDVPFYIRVESNERAFTVDRKLPERLTFTDDMNAGDRKVAERDWKRAREFVHKDYDEIRRLDWTLTRLLSQLRNVRNAIEEGRLEQYRIVQQLEELAKDPEKLPYQLPYQVTVKDYEEILLLLLERLEDDRGHLRAIEADIVAVGTTVRATDANSATLAASIRKVLVAVMEDGRETPRPPLFPESADLRAKLLAAARELRTKIAQSPEFIAWRKAEFEKSMSAIGVFLQALDQMTGLPTSAIYKTVLGIWRGDGDYLTYLKTLASFVPHGGGVAKVIFEAIEYTEKARKIATTVAATVKTVKEGSPDTLVAEATAQAKGVVFNTASRFALERVDKQLTYFKDKAEIAKVNDMLAQTKLLRDALPAGLAPGGS